jgi:uncharacterized membrane protein
MFSLIGIIRGTRVVRDEKISPRQNMVALVFFAVIGAAGVLATVPGIFWGDWGWFAEKIFGLVRNAI